MRYLLTALVAAAAINGMTFAQQLRFIPPPEGSVEAVSGVVTGLPAGTFKLIFMDGPGDSLEGQWWDKTHQVEIPVLGDGTFASTVPWVGDLAGDRAAPYFAAFIVPAAFDLTSYSCEGVAIPQSVRAAAVAFVVQRRPAAGAPPPAEPSATDPADPTGGTSPTVPAVTSAPASQGDGSSGTGSTDKAGSTTGSTDGGAAGDDGSGEERMTPEQSGADAQQPSGGLRGGDSQVTASSASSAAVAPVLAAAVALAAAFAA